MNQDTSSTEVGLSLVLCTYGRTNEVDNFLKSINVQTIKPDEIIIVDQNEEDILSIILEKWIRKLLLCPLPLKAQPPLPNLEITHKMTFGPQ